MYRCLFCLERVARHCENQFDELVALIEEQVGELKAKGLRMEPDDVMRIIDELSWQEIVW